MSYDVCLVDPKTKEIYTDGNLITTWPAMQEGGTQVVGGTTFMELNIPYNYAEVTKLFDFNFRTSLHNKAARRTIKNLQNIITKCGVVQYKDYWAPTPGNTGYAAKILLSWALKHPGGKWEVS